MLKENDKILKSTIIKAPKVLSPSPKSTVQSKLTEALKNEEYINKFNQSIIFLYFL